MTERTERSKDIGIFAVRIVLGVCFVLHGLQKVFGAFGGMGLSRWTTTMDNLGVTAPTLSAYAVAFGELAAGLALLVGFFHRTAAIIVLVIMVGGIMYVHGRNGYFNSDSGLEYNLALMAMATVILVGGPGAYAYRMELKKNSGY